MEFSNEIMILCTKIVFIEIGVIIIGIIIGLILGIYKKLTHKYNLSNLQQLIANGDINLKYKDGKGGKSLDVKDLNQVAKDISDGKNVNTGQSNMDNKKLRNPYL